ncbi:MAG: hypothetical protein P8M30_18020 [Planctomycetaceae bacterium]|nr:hypothetical protein [Planctomycetaceae bacterium]
MENITDLAVIEAELVSCFLRGIFQSSAVLENSISIEDLANLHATLSSFGGEGRGEEVINID